MKLHDFGTWYVMLPEKCIQPYLVLPTRASSWRHMFAPGPKRYSNSMTPVEGYYIQCKIYDGLVRAIYIEWYEDGTPVWPSERTKIEDDDAY